MDIAKHTENAMTCRRSHFSKQISFEIKILMMTLGTYYDLFFRVTDPYIPVYIDKNYFYSIPIPNQNQNIYKRPFSVFT